MNSLLLFTLWLGKAYILMYEMLRLQCSSNFHFLADMVTQVSSDPIENQLSPVEDSSLATPGSKHGPICGSVCIVCSDIAPPNIVFRRHYGVICCEACKCFFRRTVQMGRDYKCRFGNSCPVDRNTINMKQVCQACRFHRCTQAGMKIECEYIA